MTLTAWRFVKAKYAGVAFRGEGARKFGGRWNNPGIPIVYAAGATSLALLELLVHLEDASLLTAYVLFKAEFGEELVERLDEAVLPKDWRVSPSPVAVKAIGDRWFLESRSAVLSVPSAIVPAERNDLLNPRHPDFRKIKISGPVAYQFDPRLMVFARNP